ncbi:MAG: transposase [Bacteroidetes bacterium]|nr:transposase [Bacteroidota bacterium]
MENYKLTKAIRFKLENSSENNLILQSVEQIKNTSFDLVAFVSDLHNFIDGLRGYLFFKKNNDTLSTKQGLSIKTAWLKLYAKQAFHDSEAVRDKSRRKQTKTISDYENLTFEIQKRFDEFEQIYKSLADIANTPLNARSRHAEIGLLLKKLANKHNLPYFVDLVENTVDKKEEGDLSIQLKSLGKQLINNSLLGVQKYLPEQSSGLLIAKASFNYYTLNKKPIDYAKKKEEQLNKLKITDWNCQDFVRSSLSNVIKEEIKKGVTDLDELRQKLKNVKAQQKATFNELMTQDISYENLKENTELYLFNNISKQEFDSYKKQTEDIEAKATKLNQCTNDNEKRRLRSDLQKLKKDRGAMMNAADRRFSSNFTVYKVYANLYRDIALKQGRINATLKGIEREQVESQLLQYWALVLADAGGHKLVLIPKKHAAECYQLLTTANQNAVTEPNSIFWFESFTLRSLRKLCFGNLEAGTNSFNENIQSVLREHSYSEIDNRGQNKQVRIEGEFSFKGDTQKIINFYKDVLGSRYAQSVLNLPSTQLRVEVLDVNFENLDDFQIALEKVCYKRFALVAHSVLGIIEKQYNPQIFDITTYDLRKAVESNDKAHTQLWKEFWTTANEQNNFDIRINPEIAIQWRNAKESRVHKYGKDTALYDEKKNNRYLHEQLTLVTTISEHSNTPTKVLAFMTDDDFETSVNAFNEKFNKDDFKFALGLDNGETELATLGVYLPAFKQESNEASIAEIKKIEEHGFKVLTITNLSHQEIDKNGKERKIIQNPSYFLLKEQYTRTFGKTDEEYAAMFSKLFKQTQLLTLDLTTAKVIQGHIVTNGDVPTYFNLWMRHAQRMLWDMNDHAEKQTAKQISLKKSEELNQIEKEKFIEYLNVTKNNKKYFALSKAEKTEYTNWIYAIWNRQTTNLPAEKNKKYESVKKDQRVGYYSKHVILAVCYIGEDLQSVTEIFDVRNIFKLRKDFYAIKTEQEIIQELNNYNTNESRQQIGNEELDLKINHLRAAVVANAIGVIDSLYHYYKDKTQGEGLVVKEGFDTNKVAEDLGKFSGNIYRVLERKLYQKFQNYGLVPPIKSLMAVRSKGLKDNKGVILRLGNIGFIDPAGTSQNCPVCNTKFGNHQNNVVCENCGFSTQNIMHSNDGIAGYNIAKRGFENFSNPSLSTTNSNRAENNRNRSNNLPNNRNESQPLTALGAALAAAEAKRNKKRK